MFTIELSLINLLFMACGGVLVLVFIGALVLLDNLLAVISEAKRTASRLETAEQAIMSLSQQCWELSYRLAESQQKEGEQ
jgi:hypothetical protein